MMAQVGIDDNACCGSCKYLYRLTSTCGLFDINLVTENSSKVMRSMKCVGAQIRTKCVETENDICEELDNIQRISAKAQKSVVCCDQCRKFSPSTYQDGYEDFGECADYLKSANWVGETKEHIMIRGGLNRVCERFSEK